MYYANTVGHGVSNKCDDYGNRYTENRIKTKCTRETNKTGDLFEYCNKMSFVNVNFICL